ncbi:putative virion structural protein [Erwinia phage vB_EamM_Stratton]|uniref:Virion structural protein n=2 Tax=Erskinevirus EaH2 TaxID=2169883 RepID=J7KHD6_9CAUD|nr:virion structural protein [Erwinia phage phiEaH2]AFQ96608.1 hypothetical protein [Erwinia phage phiEaH2]ANZ50585.1 putative virion structural protein [Erwinia phage vB_EamM_Stratton]
MAIYSQSQRQYLFDAINAENPGAIMPMGLNNAIIGKPKVIPTTETGANTEIVIRGRQGRGYAGGQTFRYKRLSLNDLFKNLVATVTSPQAYGWLNNDAKKLAFVQNVNARYGLNLEAIDIPDVYVYLNNKNTVNVLATCVQYTGGITFNSVRGKNSLEEAILDDVLKVLNHPIDVDDQKLCGTMLGYSVDFTDEPQIMQAFVNGRMDVGANFTSGASDNLVTLMVSRGLPSFDFTGATIKRVKTTAEPRANTMYDNVLVITNVNDPHVGGDWLLHYND